MGLYPYQQAALDRVRGKTRCAFYHDMGLGKTYTGAAKLLDSTDAHCICVCQKAKIRDWCDHFEQEEHAPAIDLTHADGMRLFEDVAHAPHDFARTVFVVNYDLLWRRKLNRIDRCGLLFDESSLLQHRTAKRTKAALALATKADALVLLSGTPVDGKYEQLWTQLHLLGWSISESMYWAQYIDYETSMVDGFPVRKVVGYKRVPRLVAKMHSLGCDFLKTSDVLDLPEQTFQQIVVDPMKELIAFRRDRIVHVGDTEIVGDSTFSALAGERLLAAAYSQAKADALKSVLESTSESVVVFYNFDAELVQIRRVVCDLGRQLREVNGHTNDLDQLSPGDVIAVQYQAGAMGLNLQVARVSVYFSPPLSSSLFEQSKKRTHRVGQTRACLYVMLVTAGSVEVDIYRTLELRRDYTDRLFEEARCINGGRKTV